jgi:hypothetical protein
MVGQPGIVRFEYSTVDSCCEFEQGWFIDVTNIAPRCSCGANDGVCAPYGTECGDGVCGAGGECALDAMPMGMACGDATSNGCTMPDACNAFGHCAPLDAPVVVAPAACTDCPGGGQCAGCFDATCQDCFNGVTFEVNSGGPQSWTSESLGGGNGWGVYFDAPQSPDGDPAIFFDGRAPVLGTDADRLPPYDTLGQEIEHSQVTSPTFVVPPEITMESWNLDEGWEKRIELSVDGGATWTPLIDCTTFNEMVPPCLNVPTRAFDEWDTLTYDTSAFAGQTGQLRLFYNTIDSCCGFEQGWFIDNLNVAHICQDTIPGQPFN